ncbi:MULTISPECIES: DUF4149 domain-containing protein [Pseudomonas]|uniref:DUF4149 domain-containing protein n=1 Tax=Pseudomonas spirodelae TaxID=3101751 RepID=A0ABU5P9Q5_9PSED|nr:MULTISPECIES: DUF4149 domain-containing protein [unclassified Pseudomonas]MDD2159014.1 DUF4149 domain-containing protein [Pseudomonas sp. MIL19]MEA1606233.1 DUF4149 domain-containing protein [Pseudomonas sp. T5W1]
MRSSRFAISKSDSRDAGSISWLLAQTLWVGGLWLLHFLLLPAIAKIGLASLLVEEISDALRPLLVGLAAVCAGLQVVVLVRAESLTSLWRDTRGQLLLVVVVMAGSYFAVPRLLAGTELWLMFSYLVMAFCGLLLVLQPLPQRYVRKP